METIKLYGFYASFLFVLACWQSNPHDRPGFKNILESLEIIKQSEFTRAPHESFHTMQDNWRLEIQAVLKELTAKENVII